MGVPTVNYVERAVDQLFELTGINKKMLLLVVQRLDNLYDITAKDLCIKMGNRPRFRKRIQTETIHPREESRCIILVDVILKEFNIKDRWD